MSNLELFLKIERILASFNMSGKLPLVKELLTKTAKGSHIQSLIIFKTVTGTLYGPEELLFILQIKLQISCEVTGNK